MQSLEEWSFLWENPEDYLVVKYSEILPPGDPGIIFEKTTRYGIDLGDDQLRGAIVCRMLAAGVQTVESRDFKPEPTDAVKLIEECIDAGMPFEERRQRLQKLRERTEFRWPRSASDS